MEKVKGLKDQVVNVGKKAKDKLDDIKSKEWAEPTGKALKAAAGVVSVIPGKEHQHTGDRTRDCRKTRRERKCRLCPDSLQHGFQELSCAVQFGSWSKLPGNNASGKLAVMCHVSCLMCHVSHFMTFDISCHLTFHVI